MEKYIEEKIVKTSELNARSKNEIMKLSYKNKYLVSCKVEIQGEEVKFVYDLENLKNIQEIRKARVVEKYRFLINASKALSIIDEYIINFNSENVYYDYNFNIKLKERDIKLKEEIIDNEELILKYKSLIGYVFSKEYEYNDFYNGGITLLKKNKITEKYLDLESAQDVKNELIKDLNEKETYDIENIVEISEKEYKKKKYTIYGMSISLSVLLIYTVFASVFLIPAKNKVILADNYFINKDYEKVINSLSSTRGVPLNVQAKYKLAYAYITNESLNQSRKDNILVSISEKTDENILDYWIAIGKGKNDEAIDLARVVQDKEYILYAYVKKKKSIDDNTKLSGAEKEKELTEVNKQIEDYSKQISEENPLINDDSNSSQNTNNSSSQGSSTSSDATTSTNGTSTNNPDSTSSSTTTSGTTSTSGTATTSENSTGITNLFGTTSNTQTTNGTNSSSTSTAN